MGRTTPPRPVDVTVSLPELRAHAATATRLHPRPGTPAATDSSVGGPLLWPADEPWPVCGDGADHCGHALYTHHRLLTPAAVRHMRAVYATAQARALAAGQPYHLTDAERASVPDWDYSEPQTLLDGPIALVPVAQLFRRDIPDFIGPADADLLQVLWCPLDHPDEGHNPRVVLRWRRGADVSGVLAAAAEPAVVNEDYLPTPCVVHPERVVEYPYEDLLPEDLRRRLNAWEDQTGHDYQRELSVAPGWKAGGHADWSLTDPYPMNCEVCGAAMALVLTADSGEWDGVDGSWRPLEDPPNAPVGPTGVVIGRGYSLYVFCCPRSFDHPPATAMQ
jgi:hypothetical protein